MFVESSPAKDFRNSLGLPPLERRPRPPSSSVHDSLDVLAATVEESFQCLSHFSHWEAWSPPKRHYCCAHYDARTPTRAFFLGRERVCLQNREFLDI